MVMNRLHLCVCDVGNVCKGCVNLSRSCCVCTMFKLQMACGYCASVKYCRSDGERGPFLQNARVFPVYSSRLSNPPLFLALVCVWGFSSPSLECGGDLWMLLQQRHLLRWIFPSLCFSKRGGLCHRDPSLHIFSPLFLSFPRSCQVANTQNWE